MNNSKDDVVLRVMEDYVIHPRKLNRDVLQGNLTRDEYHLLVWLRGSANPYGIAIVTTSGLTRDVFGSKVTDNYTNRLLLSLRSKRYLYYTPRSGRKGSFEIKLSDFLLPTKKITTYESFASKDLARGVGGVKSEIKEEVVAEVVEVSKKSEDLDNLKEQEESLFSITSVFRGDNNDNNNYKNKNKSRKKHKIILTESFSPKTKEEEFCKNIASQLGEQDLTFILSIKDRYGISVLRQAYEETYNYQKKYKVENLPALFNSIVGKLIDSKSLNILKIN